MPTWVCRAAGPEGEFLRAAGIDKHWVTSSGYMHCVSASGKLLGGRASAQVLEAFARLPEPERAPGAVPVPDLPPEQRLIAEPPAGGLILRVHARFLAEDEEGGLRPARGEDFPQLCDDAARARSWRLFLEPNTEALWLTAEEQASLVPPRPRVGQRIAVPPAIAQRLARFHLTPRRATTSEGGILSPRDVRAAELSLTVVEAAGDRVRLAVDGHVATGAPYDAEQATSPNGPLGFGYETPVYGRLDYDLGRRAWQRFDVVFPGRVWGRWGDANGRSLPVERPGRTPFGFAVELAPAGTPTSRIPPGGNGRYVTERTGYFAASG